MRLHATKKRHPYLVYGIYAYRVVVGVSKPPTEKAGGRGSRRRGCQATPTVEFPSPNLGVVNKYDPLKL